MAFIAVLDANVLWPASLRCTLIRAAIADLYRATWTRRILEEMAGSLKRQKPDLDPQSIDRTVNLMEQNCPHMLVEGYEHLIPAMRNDSKDRHVLAAAVRAGAGTIVTSNLKHFSAASRKPYGIDLHTPDEFLCDLWDIGPKTMAQVVAQQALALCNPPKTASDVLEGLENLVPLFVGKARGSGLAAPDM